MVGEVSYLVKKQCTFVGNLEFPRTVCPSIGKCTFDMSKQFAFEKSFRDGPHIDWDQCLLFRLESRWISRASISLPVPFSPVTNMLASVRATFSIRERSCCMALLSPQNIPLSLETTSLSVAIEMPLRFAVRIL